MNAQAVAAQLSMPASRSSSRVGGKKGKQTQSVSSPVARPVSSTTSVSSALDESGCESRTSTVCLAGKMEAKQRQIEEVSTRLRGKDPCDVGEGFGTLAEM